MKTNIQKLGKILLLALMSIFVISCSRDIEDVPEPKNELTDKGHDEWARVEIIIREGHLHGSKFHANPELISDFLPKVQKVIFSLEDNGSVKRVIDKGNSSRKDIDAIEVEAGHTYYSMEIIYYDKNGDRINYQYLTPEQLDIHQHFFTIDKYTDLSGNNMVTAPKHSFFTDIHSYTYRDTNPEDRMFSEQGVTLLNNPVGLKGYFNFKKSGIMFNMGVRLTHFYTTKKNGNQWESAINPSTKARGGNSTGSVTDFFQYIPFVVVSFRGELEGEDNDSADERRVKEISEYYKINEEDVWDVILKSYIDPESSSFYM